LDRFRNVSVESAVEAAFREIERVDAKFSTYKSDSDISLINQAAGIGPVAVDEETLELLKECIRISELTNGAFDISFAPLYEFWDYNDPPSRLPAHEEIMPALRKVGYYKIIVDPDRDTVFLPESGMRIDLGGIAKGYAVDRAIHALEKSGVKNALVNAGGDLRGISDNENHEWTIGIQDPSDRSRLMGKMKLKNRAVATSGDYERFFELDGLSYSHIIDPRTGYPANDFCCIGVTVMTESAMAADAIATALFVMGWKKGEELINFLPDTEALIVEIKGDLVNVIDPSNKMDRIK